MRIELVYLALLPLTFLVSVIFNLKTAGVTLGIVEFGAASLVSFLGPRTKEAGNAFVLIFLLTNPISVTYIMRTFLRRRPTKLQHCKHKPRFCCGNKQLTSELGRHFP